MTDLDTLTRDWVFRNPSDSQRCRFAFIQDHVDQKEVIDALCELSHSVHRLQFSGHWTMGMCGCIMLYVSDDTSTEKLNLIAVKFSQPTMAELDAQERDVHENILRFESFARAKAGFMTYEALGLQIPRIFEPVQLRRSVPCLPMEFKQGYRLIHDFPRRIPSSKSEWEACTARQLVGLRHLAHSMRLLATWTSLTPGFAHVASIQEGLILETPHFPDQKDASAAIEMRYKNEMECAFDILAAADAEEFAFSSDMFRLLNRLFDLLPPENVCFLTNFDLGAHNTFVEEGLNMCYIDIVTSCEPIGFVSQPPGMAGLCIHDSEDTDCGKPCSDKELEAGRMISQSLRSVQAFFVQGTIICLNLCNYDAYGWITEVVNELLPRVNNYASGLRRSYGLAKSLERSFRKSYNLALSPDRRQPGTPLLARTLDTFGPAQALKHDNFWNRLPANSKQAVDSGLPKSNLVDKPDNIIRRQALQ